MQVTILGTGAALTTGERYQTGLLLETDTETLLVDAGNGVFQRLAQHGTPPETIDTVLLTHHHLDHVSDLPSILKARILSGKTDFTVVGPPDTDQMLHDLLAVDDLRKRASLTAREIEPGAHEVAGFDVTAVRTAHSAYCLAYRFGDRFTFSADTEASHEIAQLADGSSALIHDCAYTDEHQDPSNHPTPTSLGETLSEAGITVDELYLTHLYPDAAATADTLQETVTAYVDADVFVPDDGDTIHID